MKTLKWSAAILAGILCGSIIINRSLVKQLFCERNESEKNRQLYNLMSNWVRLKQKGLNIGDYLKERGYLNVAIYGMNIVGEYLIKELSNSGITIKYGIDKNAQNIYSDITLLLPEDVSEPVDAIIITPIFYYNEILMEMRDKVDTNYLSIEEIIQTLL